MEAIFLVCGAGGPQLKRNPLGREDLESRIQSSTIRIMYRYTIAILLAISSGCTDSLGPAELVGNYALARVNNAPPPQLVSATITCDLFLIGGRLELRTSDWSGLILDTEEDCTRGGGIIALDSLRYLGTFRLSGGTLIFETLRSINDTLRFTGSVTLGTVTLSVSDAMRGLPDPILVHFGPRQPL